MSDRLFFSLIYGSFFLVCTVFKSAAAFIDNTFFCSGFWMSSLLKSTGMGGSGVTDFSCGGDGVLRTINIQLVVNDWINTSKRSSVESTYGLIQDWDTSEVTNMHQLFYSKQTFDANLAKWNVAKVTSMSNSTFQFPFFNYLFTTCFLFLSLSPCSNYFVYFALPKFIKN